MGPLYWLAMPLDHLDYRLAGSHLRSSHTFDALVVVNRGVSIRTQKFGTDPAAKVNDLSDNARLTF